MVNGGSRIVVRGNAGVAGSVEQFAEIDVVLLSTSEADRSAVGALFTVDQRLEQLARHTRDPLVAQMRLTWWYEALVALDDAPPPAEPLLELVAAELLPRGVRGGDLAMMASGWEVLLEDRPVGEEALARFAAARGGTLFTAAACVLGGDTPGLSAGGEAWALADLAARGDPREAERAAAIARERWRLATVHRWPARLRPLGTLALLALLSPASRGGTMTGLAAAWRLTRFRLTGR